MKVTNSLGLFATGLPQQGKTDKCGIQGFLSRDILKEVQRGMHVRCTYCRNTGATVQCNERECKTVFHFPCGLHKGSLYLFFGKFISYCAEHRIEQVPPPENIAISSECPICLNPVENAVSMSSLWTPCCFNSWLHRVCIQKQALASGYFFKCPLCNDIDIFVHEMKNLGIYVPQRDAAWEAERNAFHELYYRHSRCDANVCNCPQGRKHNVLKGKWNVRICRTCGSKGCHSGCRTGPYHTNWQCFECDMLLNRDKNYHSSGSSSVSRSVQYPTEPEHCKKKSKIFRMLDNHSEESSSDSDSDSSDENSEMQISSKKTLSCKLQQSCTEQEQKQHSFGNLDSDDSDSVQLIYRPKKKKKTDDDKTASSKLSRNLEQSSDSDSIPLNSLIPVLNQKRNIASKKTDSDLLQNSIEQSFSSMKSDENCESLDSSFSSNLSSYSSEEEPIYPQVPKVHSPLKSNTTDYGNTSHCLLNSVQMRMSLDSFLGKETTGYTGIIIIKDDDSE